MAELVVLALGLAYGRGLRRAWGTAGHGRLVRPRQAASFAGGLVTTAVALSWPDRSFTAHMTQHVLLLVLAAPLLGLGAPLPTLLWALPDRARRRVQPWSRRLLRSHEGRGWVAWAAAGLVVESGVMWGWHAPVLYRAALRHGALHGLEHATLLGSAMLFWWAVGSGRRSGLGAAVPVIFVGALPGTALGAALTLASHPWYPAYSLTDQQLAGVIMWGFAGFAYVIGAAVLFAWWLRGLDRAMPARALVDGSAP